jgi:hypothetical protein
MRGVVPIVVLGAITLACGGDGGGILDSSTTRPMTETTVESPLDDLSELDVLLQQEKTPEQLAAEEVAHARIESELGSSFLDSRVSVVADRGDTWEVIVFVDDITVLAEVVVVTVEKGTLEVVAFERYR